MPSVVPGYEYDIFISYRHKDNKGEHWVSEFVSSLKTELEATFKEDISIYFDENPHDGLLETHDVSKSLESKLKCLVFIPVISQTYCDSKSYAWQHEFCTFNKMTTVEGEPHGREIKLRNGNVASRILPVKIHDLDEDDKRLLESELGSVLRGVEFIYKSAGVNRPLKPHDDRATNLNHSYYPDQINKVANAIKEIVIGIKNNTTSAGNQPPTTRASGIAGVNVMGSRRKRNIIIAVITTLLVIVTYSILQYSSARINAVSASGEKSIAVLPFKNIGPNDDDAWFSDGMAEEVTNNLAKVGELKVMSRTSVEQYKSRDKDIKTIGDELNVSYLLQGSVMKSGNKFKISVQLVLAETGIEIWTNEYTEEMTDVFQMYADISREVTDALKIVLTESERKNIEGPDVVGLTAYDFYLKGRNELLNYRLAGGVSGLAKGLPHADKAIDLFIKAIQADPEFAKAYTGLGLSFYYKGDKGMFVEKTLLDSVRKNADKAVSLDKNNAEAYYLLGLYHYQTGEEVRAIEEFEKALQINPNYVDALLSLGRLYVEVRGDFIRGISLMEKGIQLGRGPELAQNLRLTAFTYEFLQMIEKTAKYHGNAAQLDGDSTSVLWLMSWVERTNGNYENALKLANRALQFDTVDFFGVDNKAWALTLLGRYEEALKVRLAWNASSGYVLGVRVTAANRIGHLYWMLGDKKSAMKYFREFIVFGEKSIRDDMVTARAGNTPYDMAGIYAFLGEKEKAYQYLDMLNKRQFIPAYLTVVLKDDPMFDSLRNEERFQKIQKEMEDKNKRERDRVLKWLQEESMKTKLDPKM